MKILKFIISYLCITVGMCILATLFSPSEAIEMGFCKWIEFVGSASLVMSGLVHAIVGLYKIVVWCWETPNPF